MVLLGPGLLKEGLLEFAGAILLPIFEESKAVVYTRSKTTRQRAHYSSSAGLPRKATGEEQGTTKLEKNGE